MRVFESLGRFTVKFKWPILLFWVLAIPAANYYLPSFSSVTQSSNSGFLPVSSPFTVARNLENPFFAGKDPSATATIVISRSSGQLTAADKTSVAQITTKLAAKKTVVNFVRDEGISKDGQVQQLLVATTESNGQDGSLPQAETDITAIRSAVGSVDKPAGLTTHVTGTLAESVDSNSSNKTERSGATYYSVIFIIVLLLIVFRSALAPLVTLAPAVVALVIAEPIIAQATKMSSAIQVSFITQLLLIVLILGAGTDYGLFLIFRVREELRRGLTPHEAVIRGLTRVGQSITFSAATVIVALLSLLFATFGLYKGLGPGLAIGLFVMLIAALTLLPALLAILGRAVFWPGKTHAQEAKVGLWGKVADAVIKRPVLMLVAGLLVLGGLGAGVVGFTIGGFSDTSGLPPTSDSAIGQNIISQHFPAASASPQTLLVKYNGSVWSNLTALSQLQTTLVNNSSVFKSIAGPFNPGGYTVTPAQLALLYKQLGPPAKLGLTPPAGSKVPPATFEMYRAMAQFISPDGKTVQFYATLSAGASGTTVAMNAMPTARAALTNDASGAVATGILSEDAASYDIDFAATQDLEHIIPIVLIIIAVLLAIMLRSLVAPLYLIVTVGLSYIAALGFAMILFVHIRHDDGLIFILPFLMFVFSMALGEDYNILVMSRIREEARHSTDLKSAVAGAIGVTGTTVTSAGLILAGTFTVLGFVSGGTGGASGDTVMQIGLSIAFGVLLDTFFVRTLLVPSIVVLLGAYNWWPSQLHQRHREAAAGESKPSLS